MFKAMLSWETLGLGNYVDVTLTCTAHVDKSNLSGHSQGMFPIVRWPFSGTMCPFHTLKIIEELFDEHDKEFKVLTESPGPMWQLRGLEGSPAEVLAPDTTEHHRRS